MAGKGKGSMPPPDGCDVPLPPFLPDPKAAQSGAKNDTDVST